MFRHLRAGRGWELDRLTRAQLTVPEGEPEPDTALVGQGLGDVDEFAHARPIFRPDAKYRSTRLGGRQCFPKPSEGLAWTDAAVQDRQHAAGEPTRRQGCVQIGLRPWDALAEGARRCLEERFQLFVLPLPVLAPGLDNLVAGMDQGAGTTRSFTPVAS